MRNERDESVHIPAALRQHQELRLMPDFYTTKDGWGMLAQFDYDNESFQLYETLQKKYMPRSGKVAANFTLEADSMHWRGQLYSHLNGWSIILRQIPDRVPSLTDLGFEPDQITSLATGRGVILFGGPMGAGKSHTMASCTETLRRQELLGETVTVEDPIEFRYVGAPYIEQREVGVHVNTYKDGVVDAMRQSKESIIIGEIRHPSTAEAAIQAGLTGHRVMATIHADSITDAILRMWSLIGEQFTELLPGALKGVVVQHLVRQKGVPPAVLYESIYIDDVARSVLQGGPRSLASLSIHARQQRRPTISERAAELLRRKIVTQEMIEPWLPK